MSSDPSSRGPTGQESPPGPESVALMRSPGFWVIVRYAAVLGVVLAFAGIGVSGAG